MSVDYERQEYKDKLASWRLVRDAVRGEEAVKAQGKSYLPEPDICGADRYAKYLARAVYYNATGRTKSALTGIAFAKWPEVEVPAGLDYLLKDADGSGVGLVNQAQLVTADLLQTARGGLLADYPPTDRPASRAEQAAGGVRATVQFYTAEAITNWRLVKRGSMLLLGLVVLKEAEEVWDGFERSEVERRRVLKLGSVEEGGPDRYIVEVWQKGETAWELVESRTPVDSTGRPWEVIPFTFLGATNNDAAPDDAPLYDLATLNLAHYRNSADHEESLYLASQPQVWVIGADAQWLQEAQDAGIYVGSRAIGSAPQGGDVKLLQAAPVSAIAEEMKAKEARMAAIGARLIQPGEVAKTATQAGGEEKVSHSVLSLLCDNVSDAYRKVLGWCARYMGIAGETDFTIGTEFAGIQFDAQQVTAALSLVQAGKLPESDLWAYLRSVGLIEATKDDDSIRDEIETQGGGVDLEDAAAAVVLDADNPAAA
jgi:hypothetical protein